MRPLLLAALLCLPSFHSVLGQSGATNMGTDFWIGMMPNYTVPAQNIQIFVASETANDVHCDFYGGSSTPVDTRVATAKANDVVTFTLLSTTLAETRTTETPSYRAIHVYARSPIVVYGMTTSGATTDSYLGIPLHGLGTNYISVCYYDDHYASTPNVPLAGEFLIIAPYDSTHVHIGPVRAATRSDSTGTVSHTVGDQWDVTLLKGQTYLVQSTGTAFGDADLTGTPVTSDKPIAFISGHQRCSIPIGAPNDSKDHLCEMYPPVDRWGTQYYEMPMSGRTQCGDMVRIIAGEDNVIIRENGRGVGILEKKGDFIDRELVLDPATYQSVDARGAASNKKFLAVQLAYTDFYNGDQGQGDPFADMLIPREQFVKRMVFRFPKAASGSSGYTNYATFVTLQDSVTKIKINGKLIGAYPLAGMVVIPGTGMSAIRIKQLAGDVTYEAECGAPFAANAYGLTDVDSYGNPLGMGLRIQSSDTIAPNETQNSADCGEFSIEIKDVSGRSSSSGLSEIGMVQDSNDHRWPTLSYNYDLFRARPFVPGDSIAYFELTVHDRSKDAYAAIWASDRAGNDTVFEYRYTAQQVAITPQASLAFGKVYVDSDSCATVTVRNASASDFTIRSASLVSPDVNKPFELQTAILNDTLHAGDSITLQVCFQPTDSLTSRDTLRLSGLCAHYDIAIEGTGKKKATGDVAEDGLNNAAIVQFSVSAEELRGMLKSDFNGTLEVTDVIGRSYIRQSLHAAAGERLTIPLTHLSAGIYIVTLRSSAGSIQAFKFVKA